jgi:hypothetical protein
MGKVSTNEIKFTRRVGDFATEEFVAQRAEAGMVPIAGPTNAATGDQARRGLRSFGGSIVLGPDGQPVFPDPPAGFAAKRDDIPHGKLKIIEYDSKTVRTQRKMQVYTPPGYSTDKKYPVLYLLWWS